jgi:RND family efflux transporter MFP subunit
MFINAPSALRRPLTWLALLALAALAGCNNKEGLARLPDPGQGSNGTRRVRTAPVKQTTGSDVLRATGTTTALSTTKVMPLVPGLIRSIPVKEGQVVRKGQVLIVQDQRGFRLGLRQARAALEGAKIQLDALTREKKRFEDLLRNEATARSRYEQILDKYKGALVAQKQARVALDMAKKALFDSVIRAPYTGIVAKKMSAVGDYATSMPPTLMMILMQTTTLELRVSLPEPDLPRIRRGVKVEAELPAVKRTIRTTVARVVRSIDPLTRSFDAIIEIDNPDMSLEPGLFARVRISTGEPRRRVLVPNAAVLDEGNGVYVVFLPAGGVARRKVVHVTAASGDETEVLTGLEGAREVILDPSGLSDGDRIERQGRGGRTAAGKTAPAPAQKAKPEARR